MSIHRTLSRLAYTHGHHKSVVSQHAARSALNSCGYLLPYLLPSHTVLDIGCGPGSITLDLATHVKKIVGIDVISSVLPSNQNNATFQTSDCYDLPFENNSFDIVHAHQVLQHLDNPHQAILEATRVLKPGGILAIRDAAYSTMRGSPASSVLDKWRDCYQQVCQRNGAESDAGLYLQEWMIKGGYALEDLTYTTSTVTYTSSVDAHFKNAWGNAWIERALKSGFATQSVNYGICNQTDLIEISEGWKEWTMNENATWFYVNGEIIGRKKV